MHHPPRVRFEAPHFETAPGPLPPSASPRSSSAGAYFGTTPASKRWDCVQLQLPAAAPGTWAGG
eukprot:scaffold125530_cov36-Phaeocystis_antarctica.AAC.1